MQRKRLPLRQKREGICESGFDSGFIDEMIAKGSAVMYENILLSYIQSSGYGPYGMESKFDSLENEWLQGCTMLNIKADGTYSSEIIYNHK